MLVALAAAAAIAASQPTLIDVSSSLAGIVLADDLAAVGDRVEEGQVLVYVRMPLTGLKGEAATARRDGIVREVLVKVGQKIERGDVVARIEPR